MAKELNRRFIAATMTIVVDVEDDFGVISHHSIPLVGDMCPHCRSVIHENGEPDIEAAVKRAVSLIDGHIESVLPRLEKAGIDVARIKARRAAKA